MKQFFLVIFGILFINLNLFSMDYEIISQDLLYTVRVGEDYSNFIEDLAEVSEEELAESLSNENKKKAFWLNVYNAFIQIKAKNNPAMITEHRNDFFSTKWITIAQEKLSFDDIEHGILRHSQWKLGMGYIGTLFPGKFEKTFRLALVDYRIHFALNCGAAGCPPIAFYSAEKINEQLETATASFLELNSSYDYTTNTVEVSKILSWFKGDFGGKEGTLEILEKFGVIPNDSDPKIKYKEYDWTLSLQNYID